MKLAEITITIRCPDEWEDSAVEAACGALDDVCIEDAVRELARTYAQSRTALDGCLVEVDS